MRTSAVFVLACLLVGPSSASALDAEDEAPHYRIEPVPLPKAAYLEVGGLGFAPDGTLYVCTRRGEVWSYASGKGGENAWRLFAAGLHEPLGLLVEAKGRVLVVQRPELTRIVDTDGDGEADRFDVVTAAWGVSGNYHEFAFGPVRDKTGNLYGTLNVGWEQHGMSRARYRGWAWKLTPDGVFEPFAVGFRSPAGIGISPDGEVFVSDNQGDWIPTSPLHHVERGRFYGHPAGLRWEPGYAGPEDAWSLPAEALAKRRTMPAAWLPYGPAGHSPTEPIWETTGGKFGPFAGQILMGDQTKSFISRIALEKVGGEYQGAVFRFRRGFGSGITRMAFGPDGALWVGGTDRGWGATGGKPFALERLVYTGRPPFDVSRMSLTKDGFEISFTRPADAAVLKRAETYAFTHYGLRYWSTYGSPHVGTTSVSVSGVDVSADGTKVRVVLPALVPGRVYELRLRGVRAADGAPLLHDTAWYTLNRLREGS